MSLPDNMITPEQYFGAKPHTSAHADAAAFLLGHVNFLLAWARRLGFYRDEIDPDTGTRISGAKGGRGGGGFRLLDEVGAYLSSHKEARGIDIYDPFDMLDRWITDEILEAVGLYREHPDKTPGWVHLTTRAPGSGKRTFWP